MVTSDEIIDAFTEALPFEGLKSWIVLFSRDGESADFRRDFLAVDEASAWRKSAAWFRRKHPGENIAIAVDRPNRYVHVGDRTVSRIHSRAMVDESRDR